MPRCAARADEVGGDDRLPVAGRERVRGAPEERERERAEDHERAQMLPADERGEAAVRDAVGRRERLPGEERRRCALRGRQFGRSMCRRRAGSRADPSGTRAARPRPKRSTRRRRSPSSRYGRRSCGRRRRPEPSARRAGRRGSPGSASCAGPPRRAGARALFAPFADVAGAPSTVMRSPEVRSGTRCSVGISAMSTT